MIQDLRLLLFLMAYELLSKLVHMSLYKPTNIFSFGIEVMQILALSNHLLVYAMMKV